MDRLAADLAAVVTSLADLKGDIAFLLLPFDRTFEATVELSGRGEHEATTLFLDGEVGWATDPQSKAASR